MKALPGSIAILGLGLIGGSVAKAFRQAHPESRIYAYDPLDTPLQMAERSGIINSGFTFVPPAVAEAELVVFACPIDAFPSLLAQALPCLKPEALLTDCLSVKSLVVDTVSTSPVTARFIPAHPIAGSASSGYEASSADLFQRRRVILTPHEKAAPDALSSVERFWASLGAVPETMNAAMHDMVYALVSHLPQLLSYAAASTLERHASPGALDLSRYLRLSQSDAALWRQIAISNAPHLLPVLATYLAILRHMIGELEQGAEKKSEPATETILSLFPRIAASCLISTVATAEQQEGMALARYAGQGFADVVSPAAQAPEGDIEKISQQFGALLAPLRDYAAMLESIQSALAEHNAGKLEAYFRQAREDGKPFLILARAS